MHIYIIIPLFFSLDNRKHYSSATMHHVTTSILDETNSENWETYTGTPFIRSVIRVIRIRKLLF